MLIASQSDPLIPLYAVIGVVGGVFLIGGVFALIWRIRNPLPPTTHNSRAQMRDTELKGRVQPQPAATAAGTVYSALGDAEGASARYGAHLAESNRAVDI